MAEVAAMRESGHAGEAAYRDWIAATFVTIRASIGGKPDQSGSSRTYGRASEQARIGYHMLTDEGDVEFAVTILESLRRRNVGPMRWRSTSAAAAAKAVLRVHREMLANGIV